MVSAFHEAAQTLLIGAVCLIPGPGVAMLSGARPLKP